MSVVCRVVFCVLALLWTQHARAHVVISELMWMGSDVSTADEWIELANTAVEEADLTGWSLCTVKDGVESVMVPLDGAVIAAEGFLLISNFDAAESRLAVEPDIVTSAVSLPNTKLLLRLRNASGAIVDEADDGSGAPFAGANPSGGPKASMERRDLAVAGTDESNWQSAVHSIGFDDGPPIFGTPRSANVIQELPDEDPPQEATALTGALASGSILLSWTPSVSEDLAVQQLTFDPALPDGRDHVALDPQASDFSCEHEDVGVQYAVKLLSIDVAGNVSDGVGITLANPLSDPEPEPEPDPDPEPPLLLISEILSNPRGNDDEEWIELVNAGTGSVQLQGWKLAVGSRSYLLQEAILPPGRFILLKKTQTNLTLNNKGATVELYDGDTLVDAVAYPETAEEVSYGRPAGEEETLTAFCVPTPGAANEPLPLAPKIDIQSGNIRGENRLSINLQAVVGRGSLQAAECRWDFGDGETFNGCNPPSHTYAEVGYYRIGLSVDTICGPGTEDELVVQVWQKKKEEVQIQKEKEPKPTAVQEATDTPEPTPVADADADPPPVSACTPSASTGIIITEIFPSPASGQPEWVELFNTSDRALELCGWQLDDIQDGGSKPWAFPDGYRIAAGEYRVLTEKEMTVRLNNGGDDVILFAPDQSVVARVTYPSVKKGYAYALCGGEWILTNAVTRGEANACKKESEEETKAQAEQKSVAKNTTTKVSASPQQPSLLTVKYRNVVEEDEEVGTSGSFTLLTGALSRLQPLVLTGALPPEVVQAGTEQGTFNYELLLIALGCLCAGCLFLVRSGRKWPRLLTNNKKMIFFFLDQ